MSKPNVSVTGNCTVTENPDKATINFSIVSEHDDQGEVVSELSVLSDKVRDDLEDEFGLGDSLTTEKYTVDRQFQRDGEDPEHEFSGRHSYSLPVENLEDVGSVIDRLVASGVSTVDNVQFELAEETFEKCRDQAIEGAVETARHEAEVAVEAENLEIDGVSNLEVERTRHGSIARNGGVALAMSSAGSSTEIENEEVSVNAVVNIEYNVSKKVEYYNRQES